MDVREKLALTVCEATQKTNYKCELNCEKKGKCAYCLVMAEQMIANGVTVQEWISVKDHTPKEKGCYLIAGNHWWDGKPVAREAFWNGDDWLSCYDKGNISRRVTHWQYLPKPPKGE